jgi:2-dehydropantoate 2-reductase
VAVKGWQVPEVIETMCPLVGPETLVVPLLNGVEAPDQLAAAFGQSRVAGGLCGVLASMVGPGHIRNLAPHPFVTIGELDNAHTAHIERLHSAFARTGVATTLAVDIRAALWEKLALVEPFGDVAAVARAPIGVLRSMPETRALLEGAVAEVIQLARIRGAAVADDTQARTLASLDGLPFEATASMQRDIMAGRPSELETQVGVVARLAGEAGLTVPIHTFLYACLLPQERRARGDGVALAQCRVFGRLRQVPNQAAQGHVEP